MVALAVLMLRGAQTVAYSGEFGHLFRAKSAIHSG